MQRRGWWLESGLFRVFVLCGGLLVSGWMFFLSRFFYHDDAYITLRYVRHLLDGHGIVWNPGEFLQGYTNFLHLLLIAGLGGCGMDLVVASRVVGCGAFLGLLLGVVWFRRVWMPEECEKNNGFWLISLVLLMTCAPLVAWSWGGLEGNLFACLVAVGVLWVIDAVRNPERLGGAVGGGFVLGLACLVRPEGVLFWGASWLWVGWLIARPQRSFRHVWAYGVSGLLCLVPYLVWQVWYYGDLFPNTFYAKVGVPLDLRLSLGLSYLRKYLLLLPFLHLLLLAAWVGALFAARKGRKQGDIFYLFSLIGLYAVYLVYVGGDHMPAFRFGLPLIPLVCFAVGMVFSRMEVLQDRRWVNVLSLLFVVVSLQPITHPLILPQKKNIAADIGGIVGKHIQHAWPKNALVALHTAGSTPYYAMKHRYIDMLGLNDRVIARRLVKKIEVPWQRAPGHFKGDGRYVLSRRPDYIIVGPANGTTIDKPWFLSDLEMKRDPRFSAEYEMFQLPLDRDGQISAKWSIMFTYYKRRAVK